MQSFQHDTARFLPVPSDAARDAILTIEILPLAGATTGTTVEKFKSKRVLRTDAVANGKYRAIGVDDG